MNLLKNFLVLVSNKKESSTKGVQMKCIQCGQELEEGAKFCYSCGAKVQNTFCSQCGAEIPSDAKFCSSCGSKTSDYSSFPTSDKYAIETSLSESERKLVNELKKNKPLGLLIRHKMISRSNRRISDK